jgi:hypothetical protein
MNVLEPVVSVASGRNSLDSVYADNSYYMEIVNRAPASLVEFGVFPYRMLESLVVSLVSTGLIAWMLVLLRDKYWS